MRRAIAISACGVLLAIAAGANSQAEVQQQGNLRVRFAGSFAPRALPRSRPAPVKIKIEGGIATTDGSHPPPLRRLKLELNRHGRLSTRGLPVCQAPVLQSTSTEAALARCRGALVGRGSFHTSFAFGPGSTIPSDGTILAFNSRREGRPSLLLHLYGTAPVSATFVLSLKIERRSKGEFGTVMRTRIPKLAGGLGSITRLQLTVGRNYTYGGRPRSYLSASCGAPAGLPGGIFSFLRGSFSFEANRQIRTTLVRGCRVR
jgi:hypothetical protein